LIGAGKFGAEFVGADANDDGAEFGEVTEVEGVGVEHFDVDAEALQSVGDRLAFGGDVADAEIFRNGDVEGVDDNLRRLFPKLGWERRQRLERRSELLVAALGMFGVLAFQVARRTNELGVRMALGASRRAMMGLVLREVIVMVVAGVSIGAGGALVLTGLAGKILFGLTPTDPSVFLVAASVLAVAAVLAGWLPAVRASRVDPLVALRHE